MLQFLLIQFVKKWLLTRGNAAPVVVILWKVSLSNEDSLTQVSAHMNNIKLLIVRPTPSTTSNVYVVCSLLFWCGVVMWIVHDKQLSLNRSSFSKRLLILVQWWLSCEKYPPLMRTALLKCSHE